ncbi:LpqB family beta-propeller domain-containing protein [Actinoplanes sp. CA-015351]|uniref:LpqB family beta-propeller domain-containing protein n=1 Tax=Actinoplanes sp. CA-015351 TaxID=3239897 RepID=UPI003D9916D3
MRRSLPCLVVASLLVLSGCGIPDESGITVVGPGPSTGITSGSNATPDQATRTTTSDRTEFVDNYLAAAAGDYDGAIDRVKEFMSPRAGTDFKPVTIPRVIRLVGNPLVSPGDPEVVITYDLVGTLGKNGLLEPPKEPVRGKYEITLGTAEDGVSLYVLEAPPFLLITDTALASRYTQRTIYFWNTEHTGLIPDVRYMLRDVPIEQVPTTVIGWLIEGPAPWLKSAVEFLPDGTALLGKVPAIANQTLSINLSAQAVPTDGAPEALDRLRRQLQWSLRTLLPDNLALKIGHQETKNYYGTGYETSNAAARLQRLPERFAVYGGKIVRLSESPRAVEAIPAVPPQANKDVRTAALSNTATDTYAALVTGSGGSEALRVGVTVNSSGQDATLREVSGLPSGLGYPVWAMTSNDRPGSSIGMIIGNGGLYSFRAEGGAARQVQVSGVIGKITAITVAPDGHRVAIVAGGRLYRAVLAVSGDGVSLSEPELLRPPLNPVTAADFSGEGWLTVAGTRGGDGRVSVMDVTIDGALQDPRLADLGDDTVNYVTAYPANPTNPVSNELGNADYVSYTTADAAWDALSTPVRIDAADLAQPPGDQPENTVPAAPFFLN